MPARRARRALLLASAGLALLPTGAGAQTAAITQQLFDAHGDPSIVASPTPDGSKGTVSFRICRPGATTCDAATGPSEGVLEPGPEPPGTVFEARVTYGATTTTARSAPWRGRVRATAGPRLQGRAAVGERVRPGAASWAGGWGSEFDDLRVQACRRPDGTQCETLSQASTQPSFNPFLGSTAGVGAVTIDSRYLGWYVQAVDRRLARDTAFALTGPSRPSAILALTPGPTIAASRPVRIAARRVALPRVALRRVAVRTAAGIELGHVRCAARCRVVLTVSDGRVTVRRSVPVVGRRRLRVVRGTGLRPGALRVRVTFQGHELAAGRVRLPDR